MPKQPIFAGKTVFLEFLKLYFIFLHEILHTVAKWQCLKCARFLKNVFFRPKMPEIIYARKTSFLAFPQDLVIIFFTFCSKMRFRNAQNMAESDFREKIFSGRKCRKYAENRRFCRFSAHISVVLFHTKTLVISLFSFVLSFVCSFVRSLVLTFFHLFVLQNLIH